MLRPSSTHAQCRPHRSSLRQRTMSALDTTSARHRARHTPPSSNHRTPATSHFTAVIALRHYVVSIKDGTGANSPHPPPPRAPTIRLCILRTPYLYPLLEVKEGEEMIMWENERARVKYRAENSPYLTPPPLLLRAHKASGDGSVAIRDRRTNLRMVDTAGDCV